MSVLVSHLGTNISVSALCILTTTQLRQICIDKNCKPTDTTANSRNTVVQGCAQISRGENIKTEYHTLSLYLDEELNKCRT